MAALLITLGLEMGRGFGGDITWTVVPDAWRAAIGASRSMTFGG